MAVKNNAQHPAPIGILFTKAEIGRYLNLGMLLLISLNVLAVILETEQVIYSKFRGLFDGFEIFSVVIFSVEYLLRFYLCTKEMQYKHPVLGRIKYVFTPLAVIDLLAILPFYLPFFSVDLRFIRAIRLFRVFRMLKMGRYSQSLAMLGRVIRAKREELGITIFSGFILLILSSCLVYFAENKAQPEVFNSIPSSIWWGVVTLTTVGYGDVFPVTLLGKIFGAIIAVLGIGLFALPTGILASGFSAEIQQKEGEPVICPHCGREI